MYILFINNLYDKKIEQNQFLNMYLIYLYNYVLKLTINID